MDHSRDLETSAATWARRATPRPALWLLQLLAAGSLIAGPAPAQMHDLDLRAGGFSARPNPLERGCQSMLSASFAVNGAHDERLASEEVEIRFHFVDGSRPRPPVPRGGVSVNPANHGWNEIGTLRLREDWVWPDRFEPADAGTIDWLPLVGLASVHLRAEIYYTDRNIEDEHLENNEIIETYAITECSDDCGSLPSVSPPRILCLPQFPFDRIFQECLKDPQSCGQLPINPRPGLCDLVDCPPCLRGLSCPADETFELVLTSVRDLRIRLWAGDQPIAQAERVRRPFEFLRKTSRYRLRFDPEPDLSYRLDLAPGARTPIGETLRLRGQLKQLAGDSKYR